MAIILDARDSCKILEEENKRQIASFSDKLCLVSLALGENYSTQIYRSSQMQAAANLGVKYCPVDLKSDISFSSFKQKVQELNNDKNITGMILNKPFPPGWRDEEVFSQLDERKDVEGMQPANLGRFFMEEASVISSFKKDVLARIFCVSPTVLSVIELLRKSVNEYRGKKVTIVGFSTLIGKPLSIFLASQLATVSIANIATYEQGDLSFYVKNAEILISAV